jgi:ATP-dependent Clp protease ATP-binding subunit ClpA
MFERFTREARAVVERSHEEAVAEGSATIEAEHVLLALTRDRGAAGRVLDSAGLDADSVRDALEGELEHSLASVGISAPGLELRRDRAPATRSPRFATSAKLALERSLRVAQGRGERRLEPAHILLAILGSEVGTVPRALRIADVDPGELTRRTEAALGG